MQDFTRICQSIFSKYFIRKIPQNLLWEKVRQLAETFKEINLKNVLKLTVYYQCFKMKKKKEMESWASFYWKLKKKKKV